MNPRLSIALAAAVLAAGACAPSTGEIRPTNLTHGAVEMTLERGETTQAELLEALGAPNITTLDAEGREVWTWHRHSSERSAGALVGLLGGAGGAGGAVAGGSASSESASSRTFTLIVTFGPDDRVLDFRSRASSF